MALHILVLLAEFTDQKLTSEQIAKSVGCNPVMVRNLLLKLKEAGLVATRRGIGGSVLMKSPEDITIWMVYQAVDASSFDGFIGLHPNPSLQCPVGKNIYSLLENPYGRIKDGMREAMEAITLQQLLDDYDINMSQSGSPPS
jgi:Rrf2 family protein